MQTISIKGVLLALSIKYQGEWEEIYQALQRHETISEGEINEAYAQTKSQFITILDDSYPSYFKEAYHPPFVLFYYGKLDLLNAEQILGVVGSRDSSDYGEKMCQKLIAPLKATKIVIVSGMARGIDGIAHRISLKSNIPTIAILGSGIDKAYPNTNLAIYEEIKLKGLVLSEYPNETVAKPPHFPARNRIIAAISSAILLVESHQKSGSLITVRLALDLGKDIFCVPERATEESENNRLIQQGAKLVITAEDIMSELDTKN